MDIRAWSGAQLFLAVACYWTLLAIGRALYLRRPGLAARQAAAREAAFRVVEPGAHAGERVVTYTHEVRYTRPLLVAVLPPMLLALVWLLR